MVTKPTLFYDCGNGFLPFNQARASRPDAAFLCCPGPSLKAVPKDLRGIGRYIFAINTAFPTVIPDGWMGLDSPECFSSDIYQQPFLKITRPQWQDFTLPDTTKVKDSPSTVFCSLSDGTWSDIFSRRNHDSPLIWEKNTFAASVHYLIWCGFQEIYFLGCDLGGKKDYCHDMKLTDNQHCLNQRLYNEQLIWMEHFAIECRHKKISLESCTPDSPINTFLPYKRIEDVIAEKDAAKFPERPVKHCLDTVKKD